MVYSVLRWKYKMWLLCRCSRIHSYGVISCWFEKNQVRNEEFVSCGVHAAATIYTQTYIQFNSIQITHNFSYGFCRLHLNSFSFCFCMCVYDVRVYFGLLCLWKCDYVVCVRTMRDDVCILFRHTCRATYEFSLFFPEWKSIYLRHRKDEKIRTKTKTPINWKFSMFSILSGATHRESRIALYSFIYLRS